MISKNDKKSKPEQAAFFQPSPIHKFLDAAYDSAFKKNGLIELTDILRKHSEKKMLNDDFISIFDALGNDWEKTRQASGHVTYKNTLTQLTIGFSGHDKKDVSIKAKQAHLEIIQNHLNILFNHILENQGGRKKNELDYSVAERNYNLWLDFNRPDGYSMPPVSKR